MPPKHVQRLENCKERATNVYHEMLAEMFAPNFVDGPETIGQFSQYTNVPVWELQSPAMHIGLI